MGRCLPMTAKGPNRWRLRRFQHDLRRQPWPRGLAPALVATTLISSGVIAASALNGERFKNELLTQFAEEKVKQIAENLEAETLDWAVWDETNDHLLGRNNDYYREQYNQYSFARTPFVAAFDTQGRLFSSTTWDAKRNQAVPLNAAEHQSLQAQLPGDRPLEPVTFLGRFADRPFLFSAQPVRSTDDGSQPSGRLLFVRPLDTQDVSFKDSSTLSRALGVTREYYGNPEPRQANPLAPLQITAALRDWQGRTPMQLVIERQPRERLEALGAITVLVLGSGVLVATVQLRGYAQARRFRHLERRNQRQQVQTGRDLERRRNSDALTGLHSEPGLLQGMEAQSARYPGFKQVIAQIDLDHFSLINNGLGKNIGNQVLVQFAEHLRNATHASAVLARLGSDEFACSLIGTSEASLRSEISQLSQQLNDLQISVDSQNLNLTVSIGATMVNDQQYATALHEATVACSVVKINGGHSYQFYGDAQGSTSSYLAIQQANQELVTAIRDHRLELHGQQAWQLTEADALPATYVELLCRIQHPDSGKPYWKEAIIDAAQFCGSLTLFDQTIVELACNNLQRLQQQPLRSSSSMLVYAINITPDTLVAPSFVQTLDELVDRHELDPHTICLEITEQAALRNPGEAVIAMKKLRQLGFKLALDDFGTGMTSLGYLRDLPLDFVKIDKSFIRKLPQDKSSSLVVQFVVELSREIGFQTIAEGVEDMEQLLQLQAMGISIAQGYVITRPQPLLAPPEAWNFHESGARSLAEFRRQGAAA